MTCDSFFKLPESQLGILHYSPAFTVMEFLESSTSVSFMWLENQGSSAGVREGWAGSLEKLDKKSPSVLIPEEH